ncbi:hypothetical protein RZQ20_20185, partial [Raoultella ornithinolytica]|nr:hypothetical protein [Klebsiella pneumoniae]MCJ7364835.1 hypothetical protein [Klebsiella quasipneumoniae]MDV0624719.1 hypothetical protein [Klebsiella variicola subsp. variicola]MDV1094587.1 hypothetical protein [Raoultella ornithinolytica]MCJ5634051.1 hypothetical protein [Klebsiella pneumoniae]
MIFYDNAFRLRIPHTSIYRIHQHLDFFVQERKGEKLPYSFKILPGTANDAQLLVRTASPLGLPGEKPRELTLLYGSTTYCNFYSHVKYSPLASSVRVI